MSPTPSTEPRSLLQRLAALSPQQMVQTGFSAFTMTTLLLLLPRMGTHGHASAAYAALWVLTPGWLYLAHRTRGGKRAALIMALAIAAASSAGGELRDCLGVAYASVMTFTFIGSRSTSSLLAIAGTFAGFSLGAALESTLSASFFIEELSGFAITGGTTHLLAAGLQHQASSLELAKSVQEASLGLLNAQSTTDVEQIAVDASKRISPKVVDLRVLTEDEAPLLCDGDLLIDGLHHRLYVQLSGRLRLAELDALHMIARSYQIALDREELRARVLRDQAWYRALAESATDLVAVCDSTGRVRFAGDTLRKTLTLPEDVEGTAVQRLLHPDDRQTFETALAQVLRTPGIPQAVELRWLRPHGKVVPCETVLKNQLHNNAVAGIVLNARDLSERYEAEAQLDESRARFREAQKLEAVGRLAGGIAHDFNNLLSVIRSYSVLLMRDAPPKSTLAEDLGEIDKAARRAAELTRKLLTFSRRVEHCPERIELNHVITDQVRSLSRLLGEDIAIHTQLADEALWLEVDAVLFEQVILNLAVNARDAMPSGGVLTLSARREGDWALLAIQDTGTGMTPDVAARAFQPFFTTKEIGKGTGLGLAMIHGFVEQCRGRIALDSVEGGGTTITIRLALAEAPQSRRVAEHHAIASSKGKRILVVEDDEWVLRATVRVLRSAGHHVHHTTSCREALELINHQAQSLDLLLTDMVMPEMSGLDLAAQVEVQAPLLPVLFMSGYSDEVMAQRGVSVDQIALVPKPFTPAGLIAAIEERLAPSSPKKASEDIPSAEG